MLRAADEVRAPQFGGGERDLDAEMVRDRSRDHRSADRKFRSARRIETATRRPCAELIEAKMKGLTVEPREMAAPPQSIDLMAACEKRSLCAGGRRRRSALARLRKKSPRPKPDRRQPALVAARQRRAQAEDRGCRRTPHQCSAAAVSGLDPGSATRNGRTFAHGAWCQMTGGDRRFESTSLQLRVRKLSVPAFRGEATGSISPPTAGTRMRRRAAQQ